MADDVSRSGQSYATPAILAYTTEVHARHSDALSFAFDASTNFGLEAIQVGPNEGKFLNLLVQMTAAKRVVEVGTLGGYSALWMASALPDGGRLFTIDHDQASNTAARTAFTKAPYGDKITMIHADGLSGLESIEADGPFDMVFLDADKERYFLYGRWAAKHLRKGGLLIGDNSFYFGQLTEREHPGAQAVRTFHEEMAQHFDSVCLPTPDGLAVGIKR